jgi:hypothetical protein
MSGSRSTDERGAAGRAATAGRRARHACAAIVLCATCALPAAPAAFAAGPNGAPDVEARYRSERERCERIEPAADRATCLREAAAARAEARRGRLANGADDPIRYLENALRRCEPLPPDDRADCEYRVRGGGTTRGSVEEGGIYRETVTREVERPREIHVPDNGQPAPK